MSNPTETWTRRRKIERGLADAHLSSLKPSDRHRLLTEYLRVCAVVADERTGRVDVSPPWSLDGLSASLYLAVAPSSEVYVAVEEALSWQGIVPLDGPEWRIVIHEPLPPQSGRIH